MLCRLVLHREYPSCAFVSAVGMKGQLAFIFKRAKMSSFQNVIKDYLKLIPWETRLQKTLSHTEVSSILHEPAILDGYRVPYQPWNYYFYSLFQVHNETVNVWTHLIGSLVLLHQMYEYLHIYDVTQDKQSWPLFVFGICCLIALLTSAVVHLIHSKSPYVHFTAFMVDYIGATFYSYGTCVIGLYSFSEKTTYTYLERCNYFYLIFAAAYLNFINLCVAKLGFGHDPHDLRRKYMFIGGMLIQAIMCMIPFVPRFIVCHYDAECSFWTVSHLALITLLFFLQALAFCLHQPERLWPGKFDIVGHGHQIFHVLIVANMLIKMTTAHYDNMRGANEHSQPDAIVLFSSLVVLYVADVLTLLIVFRYVDKSIARVEKAK